MEGVIAVSIPIFITLIVGIIVVTGIYFGSREKQMLIEKGLSPAEIKEFLQKKKDKNLLLKIGIIMTFFGLGLGFGMFLEDATSKEFYVPLSIFVSTGVGFILANKYGNKKEVGEEVNE